MVATVVALAILLAGNGPRAVLGQTPTPRPRDAARENFVTPAADRAIQRGLTRLVSMQQPDGSFGSGLYRRNVAVTGLAGMAFLSSGSTPGRGPFGSQLTKTVDYLLTCAGSTGLINEADNKWPMYGHGFATLFLAEVYGMSPRDDVRDKLKAAVNLIITTQNKEGGWRYQPERVQDADLSVSVCQIMALRAARNAGLHVPKSTVEACNKYVRQSQNADGGFKYQLVRGSESRFALTAAGLVSLFNAGIYEGSDVDRGLAYLMKHLPGGGIIGREPHYFYGQYYAVQATWQAGGDYWRRWYPAIRDELLGRQAIDGSWPDPTVCSEYGTAMALIILQMPNNSLPIFQR
jgi:hypothetical protein